MRLSRIRRYREIKNYDPDKSKNLDLFPEEIPERAVIDP